MIHTPNKVIRRHLIGFAVASAAAPLVFSSAANAQQTIRIGEINSYKAQPAFLEPYRKGWEMAVSEINEKGGINGKKIEVISRDDNANPGDAVRVAEELVSKEKVDLIFGSFLSNIGLALTDFAKQRKVVFVAAEPLTDKITWQNGNRYTFRLRPSTYIQAAMLVPEAAKQKKKRWAIVYPNYEYGQSAAATFKQLLKAAQPDVEFVAEQAPALGKIDAGAVAQAISDAKPDAIFNVTFGADLAKFVREGQTRGLFKDKFVVSLLTGEPEYLDPLREEAPEGWWVTGYPWYSVKSPEHDKFVVAYQKKWREFPRAGSLVGYSTMMSVAAALNKAKASDTESIIAAFKNLKVDTPVGKITFRAQDNQSTMGAFVGYTAINQGRGVMKNFKYVDGASVMPADADIKKLRPEN